MRTIAALLWLMIAACTGLTPDEQYDLGAAAYELHCEFCHLPGGVGPALDAKALAYWQTAGKLNTYNRDQMPYNASGTLTDAQYRDITAYLLRREGLLAAHIVLDYANMDSIRLAAP